MYNLHLSHPCLYSQSPGKDHVTNCDRYVTHHLHIIPSWTLGIEAWMAKVQIIHEFKATDQGYLSMLFL
jgi:hypothetical protein